MTYELTTILDSTIGGICCEFNPEHSNRGNKTEHEILVNLVTRGDKFSIRTDLCDIYTVLNMQPFPYGEIIEMAALRDFDEKTKRWIEYTPKACKAWLENVYKTIEREAWRQGKLELHYKKEKWFLIYSNPPQHLKDFLTFISPRFVKLSRPHPRTVFELSNDKGLMEQIAAEPEKFNTVFEDFIKITDKENILHILREGTEIMSMSPFPRNWVLRILFSAAVYADVEDDRRGIFFMASDYKFCDYLLTQLKQQVIRQRKL